jgi:hypothetical protein
MPDTTTDHGRRETPGNPSAWRRFGWFVVLYLASFAAFSIVAYALRWLTVPD